VKSDLAKPFIYTITCCEQLIQNKYGFAHGNFEYSNI